MVMVIRRKNQRLWTPGLAAQLVPNWRHHGGGGGGAPPWAPSDASGLHLWVKADAGTFQNTARTTPAVANNDPVGGWQDFSGQGNHVAQATAGARPLLKTNVLNGKPGLLFDGTDDVLSAAGGVLGGSQSLTYAVAVTFTDLSKGNCVFGPTVNTIYLNASSKPIFYKGSSSSISTKDVVVNTPLIFFVVYDATLGYTWMWHDGLCARGAAQSATADDTMHLGAYTGTGQYLAGRIHEALVYNRALNGGELASALAYLNGRWATHSPRTPNPLLVYEGDSITAGYGASSGYDLGTGLGVASGGTNYPSRVTAALTGTFDAVSVAHGGDQFNSPGEEAVDLLRDLYQPRAVLAAGFGSNDLSAQASVAVVESQGFPWLRRRVLSGYRVAQMTIMDRADYTTQQRTDRGTFNADVRALVPGTIDAVLDVAADSIMGPNGAYSTNSSYFIDTIHPNDAGYVRIAAVATPVIQSLLS